MNYITNEVVAHGIGSRVLKMLGLIGWVNQIKDTEFIYTPLTYEGDGWDFGLQNQLHEYSHKKVINPKEEYLEVCQRWDNTLNFNGLTTNDIDRDKSIKLVFPNDGSINTDWYNKENRIKIRNSFNLPKKKDKNYIDVAIHIRRGDVTANNVNAERWLGDEYYLNLINTIEKTLGNKCKITIYTQRLNFDSNLYSKYNIVYDDESLDNEVWVSLINADILAIGLSSYSYSAGILSEGLCVYPPGAEFVGGNIGIGGNWVLLKELENKLKTMKKKTALITGINGQDGSYLAEFLLEKGYAVWGTVKRNSVAENQTSRLDSIFKDITLEYADLNDLASLIRVIQLSKPDEIYNLAAQSHVRISFDQPIYTAQTTGIGTLNLLEAIKLTDTSIKMYQASSSEMFGNSIDEDGFQRESTPLNPVSPYGCAKVFSYNICRNYRNAYNLFVSNGILFNHESPRRGTNFVTNKVVKTAVEIKKGLRDNLSLGNLDATRDWGHAKDYVEAMWLMLQQDVPGDYVCATGVSHSVKDLCEYVFNKLDLNYKDYVTMNPKFLRAEELRDLKGDSSELRKLGWKPKHNFESLLDDMINHWMNKL